MNDLSQSEMDVRDDVRQCRDCWESCVASIMLRSQ